MNRVNFWSGLFVCVFSIAALFWIIPTYAGRSALAAMPPDLLPRIASWIMLVSGGVVTVSAAVRMHTSGERFIETQVDWRGIGWALWPFVYVAFFIWLVSFVKLTWLGVPMIGLMLFLFGERRWYMLLSYSVIPVVLVYLLSTGLMRVGVI